MTRYCARCPLARSKTAILKMRANRRAAADTTTPGNRLKKAAVKEAASKDAPLNEAASKGQPRRRKPRTRQPRRKQPRKMRRHSEGGSFEASKEDAPKGAAPKEEASRNARGTLRSPGRVGRGVCTSSRTDALIAARKLIDGPPTLGPIPSTIPDAPYKSRSR